MDMQPTVLADVFKFPESPRWHDGALWLSDLFQQQVARVDLNGSVEIVATVQDTPIGLGWSATGALLVVSADARHLLRVEGETLVPAADLSSLVQYALNDMVIDAHGRAYIGSVGYDFGNPDATPALAPLLLVAADGTAWIVAEGLAFPNGMAITPDGNTLLVAESHAARITAFDIAADGSLGNRRVWAQFEEGEQGVTPDGISLDAEGALWVASPNTRDVLRVREGGEVLQRVIPKGIPLACMLGGVAGRTLFMLTTDSLNPYEEGSLGRIEMLEVAVAGAELP